MSKYLKTTKDKIDYFKLISKDYLSWSKKELYINIVDFLKETKQYMDFFELRVAAKFELQGLYKYLVENYTGEQLCQ